MRPALRLVPVVWIAIPLVAISCAAGSNPLSPTPIEPAIAVDSPVPAAAAPDAVFVGAGDIAMCGSGPSGATARLLDRISGDVFVLGDNVYPTGTSEQYANCYEPTWGRHRHRTHAAPGNHEWYASEGAPYFAYFGGAAGPAGVGYYSFDLGGWHILSLNSNAPAHPGSPQYEWTRNDLAINRNLCTLAYWHHPVFSSGAHGNNEHMAKIWRLLRDANAEVVLTAHDHDYERFAPQDAEGRFDPGGVREFVVGTGGVDPRAFSRKVQANSEVRDSQTWGVLKLTLRARSYGWEFVPIDGQAFRDSGSADCH